MSLRVSVSLLMADWSALGQETRKCEQWGIDTFHLDIMDYDYAGDQGFNYRTVQAIRTSTKLPVDLHLMVRDPLRYFENLAALEPKSMTFQLESSGDTKQCVQMARKANIKAGIAIEPSTPVSAVYELAQICDIIIVMGVVPGKAGSHFEIGALSKIKQLRLLREDLEIYLDGGVGYPETVSAYYQGCNQVVFGTALFNSANPFEFINKIKKKVRFER